MRTGWIIRAASWRRSPPSRSSGCWGPATSAGATTTRTRRCRPSTRTCSTAQLAWRQHDGGHTDGPNVEHFIRWAEARWREAKKPDDPAKPGPDRRSLKEAAGDRFKIGVGVGQRVLEQPEDAALIRQHFQILTPENCMKPQSIHPAEDSWNFEAADRFVAFARANKLEVVGHCLVWAKDDRTDEWMKQENGEAGVARDAAASHRNPRGDRRRAVCGRRDDVGRGERGDRR